VKKKLIRGIKIFNWRVKLNWNIDLIERKTNQKKDGQTGKKKTTKKLIEWWNWKLIKLQRKCQGEKKKDRMKNKTYRKLQLKN